ncbi:MAG: type V CRISPR-associated protein Cas4 [Solobacterium sp.]|jgi:CRISPR-associated protein Cas4|nr:type V CRISPR-associated protein Cas4 [Solobacterium sp.]
METILISNINDFIFCPVSIYFHNLYYDLDKSTYQSTMQTQGTAVHQSIDKQQDSGDKRILYALDVYSEQYGLEGKIDSFKVETGELIERKKKIVTIYDGYIFQLFAEYYCMREMGYQVNKLALYSYDDNKKYPCDLPDQQPQMKAKFINTLNNMRDFVMDGFKQSNIAKCSRCIYEPACSFIDYDEQK